MSMRSTSSHLSVTPAKLWTLKAERAPRSRPRRILFTRLAQQRTQERDVTSYAVEDNNMTTALLANGLWVVLSVTSIAATVLLFRSFMDAKLIVDKRREDPVKKEKERQEKIQKLTGQK